MTDPATTARNLLDGLRRLPSFSGIVYHGLPADAVLDGAITLAGVVSASEDPRVATANFAVPGIAAVISRTGRAIGPFSERPAEREVVLLPGTVLLPVARFTAADGIAVVVLDELAPAEPSDPALPPALTDVTARIGVDLAEAAQRAAITVFDARYVTAIDTV